MIIHIDSPCEISLKKLAKKLAKSNKFYIIDLEKLEDITILNILNKYKKNNKDISRKMDDVNPCYIPRNHIIERGLGIASEGDISEINEINELLRSPHLEKNISKDYLSPSSDSDLPYITYCGT